MPRRTVDEIVERYRREPGIQLDVYVEGVSDKELIEWVLRELGFDSGFAIYPIETVEIPDEELKSLGLPTGSNRSRVEYLAERVASLDGGTELLVAFVVDRDLDEFLGWRSGPSPLIVRTEFTCMESPFWRSETACRFLQLIAGLPQSATGSVASTLFAMVSQLFFARVHAKRENWNSALPKFEKSASVSKGSSCAEFDLTDFCRRFASKAMRPTECTELEESIETEVSACSDVRHSMNGHDMNAAFFWFTKQVASKTAGVNRAEAVFDIVRMAGLPSDIDSCEPFVTLLTHARAASSE